MGFTLNQGRRHLYGLIFVFAIIATLVLAACGGTSSYSTQTNSTTSSSNAPTQQPANNHYGAQVVQVQIVEKNNEYSFEPATITIPKGTKVVWTNNSDAPHTVTSDTNVFSSNSTLSEKQTYAMVFNTAGTYAYHCNIHTYMKGIVIVTS
jgi:plastocyanin